MSNRENGQKFEYLVESILKHQKVYNLMRHVHVKAGEYHREIDVLFDKIAGNNLLHCMVECKYTAIGKVADKYRQARRVRGSKISITGPLEQVVEAKAFGGFDQAYIATNGVLSKELKLKAKRTGIIVLEHDWLLEATKKYLNLDSLGDAMDMTEIDNIPKHRFSVPVRRRTRYNASLY